jgi:hypothetical protein
MRAPEEIEKQIKEIRNINKELREAYFDPTISREGHANIQYEISNNIGYIQALEWVLRED